MLGPKCDGHGPLCGLFWSSIRHVEFPMCGFSIGIFGSTLVGVRATIMVIIMIVSIRICVLIWVCGMTEISNHPILHIRIG
jgi:hypothetical protein